MNSPVKIAADDFVIPIEGQRFLYPATQVRLALSTLSKPMVQFSAIEAGRRYGDVLFLADLCHAISWSRGWWTNPNTGATLLGCRNFGEMLALIHSEISETFEASSKLPADAIDAKTGHPEVATELADVLIRLFDLIKAESIDVVTHIRPTPSIAETLKIDFTLNDFCVEMHADVTQMLEAHRKSKRGDIGRGAMLLIDHVFEAATFYKLDLTSAFLAKCAYNLNRPDHSMEARRAAGGKAY